MESAEESERKRTMEQFEKTVNTLNSEVFQLATTVSDTLWKDTEMINKVSELKEQLNIKLKLLVNIDSQIFVR